MTHLRRAALRIDVSNRQDYGGDEALKLEVPLFACALVVITYILVSCDALTTSTLTA